jgi:hypothetical protein
VGPSFNRRTEEAEGNGGGRWMGEKAPWHGVDRGATPRGSTLGHEEDSNPRRSDRRDARPLFVSQRIERIESNEGRSSRASFVSIRVIRWPSFSFQFRQSVGSDARHW